MKVKARIASIVLLGGVLAMCQDMHASQKQVTYAQTVGQATPLLKWASPTGIGYGQALSSVQLDAAATGVNGAALQGTFTYSPGAGTVLNAGIQTLSVTFTPTDSRDYVSVTQSVPLVVDKAMPILNWSSPGRIVYGTAIGSAQLNATATSLSGASIPGTFVYTPSSGTVLGVGTQKVSVTFTPTNTANYAVASASVDVTVTQAQPALTWSGPAAITYGATLSAAQLDASAAGVTGSALPGAFMYSPSLGTLLTAGNHLLSVTFTPSDSVDYAPSTMTVPLVVNKATPPAAWTTPDAITVGTPLGGAQLNASAAIEGAFAYSPGAGTMLPVGVQTLQAQFTPADTANYNAVPVVVNLRVTDFAVDLKPTNSTTVAFGSGDSVKTSVNLTSITQFVGNVGLTCTNVPATMGCKFETSVVPLGPSGATTTLQITTTGRSVTYTGFILFFGGISCIWGSRRRLGRYSLLLIASLGLMGVGLVGCAGGSQYTQFDGTPKGTYTITVSGTAGNLVHSVPITVVVQ